VKLLFHIVFCCCYHVYGELKIVTSDQWWLPRR